MASDPIPVQIIADYREERSGVVDALRADPTVSLSLAELPAGDYQIAEKTIVERKGSRGMDFCASILDRRLFQQVDRIKEMGLKAIFIIEGDVYRANPNIHINALVGAISYLPAIEGIPLIPTPDVQTTAKMIATLGRHSQQGLGYVPGLRPATPKSLRDRQRWLLIGLPGIGESRIEALLAHFGSPLAVLTASVEQLCQVEGIGKKTAQTIREVLDSAA